MDFCPRCGRYLEEGEYQCRECGNMVRMPKMDPASMGDGQGSVYGRRPQPVDLKKMVFEKYFFIALAIAFAISFTVTYYWRFTILFFCIPLFLPMGRISIAAGTLLGLTGGSLTAILAKMYLLNSAVL